MPTALVFWLDVVLMYLVARHIFKSDRLALISAGLLALTPAHFIYSAIGRAPVYPVPFILVWLLCLDVFLERRQAIALAAGTAALALGISTYPGAAVMMPVYLLATCLALLQQGTRSARIYLVAVGGFILPLVPLAPWLFRHRGSYADLVTRYKIYDAHTLNPLQGLKEFLNYNGVQERISAYWDYFDPVYLFLSGGPQLGNSTRHVGVFLLPFALLLPLGLYRLIARRDAAINVIVLVGFAAGPLAAVLIDERYVVHRELSILPFAILAAVTGLQYLLSADQIGWRAAAIGLLALAPIQFLWSRS
jgi:hypothetical protein